MEGSELTNKFEGRTPMTNIEYDNTMKTERVAIQGARVRNLEGLKMIGGMASRTLDLAKAYAERAGLQIDWTNPATAVPRLAVISQTPREFDFPGIPWPPQFHYTGPFHESGGRASIPFRWELLNGKPLIYASLGTLVNGLDHVYRAIVEAAIELPEVQLVLSVGYSINPDELPPSPPDAIIVRTAPQIELLKGAALCITHAGLNTTLEALAQGVPIVALPIAYDQPGVAARIQYHGVGESLEVETLSGPEVLGAIRKVLNNPGYRERARYFQDVIAKTRGLEVAADRIEQAVQRNAVLTAK
jgi:zeaxanthin glucosyltransferase